MPPTAKRYYCQSCGAAFASSAAAPRCDECGRPWGGADEPESVAGVAALLNWIEGWRSEGSLASSSYQLLRRRYESRLEALLERRAAAGSARARRTAARSAVARPAVPAARPAAAAGPVRPAPTGPAAARAQVRPRPPRLPTVDLTKWAAERQADILLYLGAFLLVSAAIIFVNYQGGAITGGIRVAVLAIYTAGFVAAGLLVRRWERAREAGPVFLLIGALFTPLTFVLLHVELLDPRSVPVDVIWLAGSGYSGLFYAILAARGYGRIYAVPAVPALLIAWGALASVVSLPPEWVGAWYLALTVVSTALAPRQGWLRPAVVAGLAILAAAAILEALLAAAFAGAHDAQLGVSLVLLSGWFAVLGEARRAPLLLVPAAISATGAAVATLWAAGLGSEWYVYPILLSAALAVATRALWAHWSRELSVVGWAYAAVLALSPLAFIVAFGDSWHGAASHLIGAAVFAAIAWRNGEGELASSLLDASGELPRRIERVVFGWTAFGLLLAAVALAQRSAGIEQPETGWAYLALAIATGLAIARLGRRHGSIPAALFPPFTVAIAVSFQPWESAPGHDAVLLGAPALTMGLAFATTRRYSLATAGAVLSAAAAAAAWSAFEWSTWTLAVAYGGAGAAAFLGLTRLRRYRAFPSFFTADGLSQPDAAWREAWLLILSWGLPLAAPVTAAVALGQRLDAEPAAVGVETVEYRALVFLALALAPLIAFEGWRLRNWHATALATGWAAAVAYAIWPAFDWPLWTLAVTFTGLGAGAFLVLTRLRRYGAFASFFTAGGPSRPDAAWREVSLLILSWGLLLAAPVTAAVALGQRLDAEPAVVGVETVEYRALVFLALALAPLIAFEGWRLRNWHVTALATALAAGVTYAIWPAFDRPLWTLAVTFMGLGAARFAMLTPLRRSVVPVDLPQASIALLSWGPLLLAPATVWIALGQRLATGDVVAQETVEYRLLAVLVLLLAPPLLFEARRFREWNVAALALGPIVLAMALAWPVFGWPAWTLGAVYWAAGTALFVLLTSRRTYEASRQRPGILVLSWSLLSLGVLTAILGVGQRADQPGVVVDQTVEYGAFATLTLLSVAHVLFEARRLPSWNFAAGAGVLAAAGLSLAWPALAWPGWSIALVYAGLGGGLLVALAPYREYAANRRNPAVLALSWGFLALALLVAYNAMTELVEEADAVVRTAEYYSLTAIVLACTAAVAYEGRRLGDRRMLLVASAIAMASLLMAVAIARPDNVQAYTVSSAVYLIALGLVVRRSPPFIGSHLVVHELATVGGVLTLVLPQAEQSFDPGGAWWGGVLLLESMAFVVVAFLLHARWLSVAGVLTASGVGIRWIAESGDTVPYWAILGAGGMLLIAAGTSLLVHREHWERLAARTVRWWRLSVQVDTSAQRAGAPAARAEPDRPPRRPAVSPAAGERLWQLEALRNEGLITDEEFERKRDDLGDPRPYR